MTTVIVVPTKECGAQGAPTLTRGSQEHFGLGHGHRMIQYWVLVKINHRRCSGHALVQVWSLTTPNNPAGPWLPLAAPSVCTLYPQEDCLHGPECSRDLHVGTCNCSTLGTK